MQAAHFQLQLFGLSLIIKTNNTTTKCHLLFARGCGCYTQARGWEKLLLLRTLAVRHSCAGQPSVRSGKRMVAKSKKEKKSAINCSNR